jgi:LuxR family transcriptional regulator, maltose regulon positive regulatory protein
LLGESTTVERWLAALPAELISSRPRLCLAQAFQAISHGDVEAIEPLLDAAEHALAVAPGVADEPFEPSAGRGASQLANIPAAIALGRAALAQLSGDAEGAMRFGRRTLAELGEGEWMLESITRGYLALAEWLHGELTEAERALSSAFAQAQAAGAATMAAWVCHHLGLVQRAQARLDAAAATYQQALEITTPPGRPALPAAGIAYVGLAEVAYQRDELNAALRDATEGVAACRQFPYVQPLANRTEAVTRARQLGLIP